MHSVRVSSSLSLRTSPSTDNCEFSHTSRVGVPSFCASQDVLFGFRRGQFDQGSLSSWGVRGHSCPLLCLLLSNLFHVRLTGVEIVQFLNFSALEAFTDLAKVIRIELSALELFFSFPFD